MYGYRIGDRELPMWTKIKRDFGLKYRTEHLRFFQVRRPVAVSLGPHITCLPKPDLGDGLTLVGGVLKRFAFRPPKPKPGKLNRLETFIREKILPRLTPLAIDVDVTTETWLKGTAYPDWRKQELLQVFHKVVEFGPATVAQARVNTFMKDEGYLEFKQARAINARADEMKVRWGPIFKQIEKKVYEMEEFIKHIPVRDRAKYIAEKLNRAGVKFVCSDFVSFESLFTSGLMRKCERVLYDYMTSHLPCHDEFMRDLDKFMLGNNHLYSKFFKANLRATRMSGEMCTSLGNGWTTMCVFYFVCSEVGFERVKLVVEGDDNAASGEGVPPTAQDFADLGLVIKLENHETFSEMSFCGLVFDEVDLEVVTDPRKVLASFAWSSREYVNARQGKLKALLRCKALSLMYQYPACPVVSSLADYLLRETSGVDVRRIADSRSFGHYQRQTLFDALACPLERRVVGFGTRAVVEKLFNISVLQQLKLERYFDDRMGLDPITSSWIVDMLPDVWQSYFVTYSHDHSVGQHTDAGFWFPTVSEQRRVLESMLPELEKTFTPSQRS